MMTSRNTISDEGKGRIFEGAAASLVQPERHEENLTGDGKMLTSSEVLATENNIGTGFPKVLIIGLDSMPADLFDNLDDLPNIRKMVKDGFHSILESCHPPITIPAWMVMMTGKSPGELGIYGFRHRKGSSYKEGWIATSQSVHQKRVWDYLAERGLRSCLVGVPPSYPPYQLNGNLVSCFITPSIKNEFTYPPELKNEIQHTIDGEYMFDVAFRTDDRDAILRGLYEMTEKRFSVIKHLMKKEKWNFFMFVEIGVDRIHHAFWKFHDKSHPKYIQGNKYENVIREYYKFIDQKIGELIDLVDDDTYILTVSDHGTTGMRGCFCINEWMIQEGLLSIRDYPEKQTDIDKCNIDWSATKAWGWGGYYARIFLNVKGREPNGVIPASEYEKARKELRQKLAHIKGPNGEVFDNKVYTPEELYGDKAIGDKPDLMVYFDNLYWRSAGTIGHRSLYLDENDTGPDDSVHWYDGIFILYNKRKRMAMEVSGTKRMTIYDVAPTILDMMGLNANGFQGKAAEEISRQVKSQ
jgi:predicted AlkP superfamily phosphohydrolase/phosphomutase